jgi:hypothetical protein
MTATGGALAQYNVPWTSEEPVQALAVWIYSADQNLTITGGTPTGLGGGTAQVFLAGEAQGSPTAFAGNVIELPMHFGTDTSEIHPQTTSKVNNYGKLAGLIYVSPTTNLPVLAGPASGDPNYNASQNATPPVSSFVQVINTDAEPKDIIVHFMGLAWRNT